jgi:membrane-bound serine protease (ClpP class)
MPVRIGQESLVQKVGVARSELNPEGSVQLGSELWTAVLEDGGKAAKGSRVEVVRVNGIQLVVRKME